MKKKICQYLAEVLVDMSENELMKTMEIPPEEKMGDLALPCFAMAKKMRKNPMQIANELAEKLNKQKDELGYVNSIKACANNVFEYNMRINPNAKIQQPLVVPDEEFIASVHPATNILDNSNAVLLGEFEVDYDMAKSYANSLKRKVLRVHWKTPAKIKIYVNIV